MLSFAVQPIWHARKAVISIIASILRSFISLTYKQNALKTAAEVAFNWQPPELNIAPEQATVLAGAFQKNINNYR